MDIRFLVIEGNIGAGKTSLATMLAEELDARLLLEQFADNPFLPKFYAEPERYSFPLELSFLADRYNQIKNNVLQPQLFHRFLISDYYFNKTAIFAANTLQPDEYDLFRRLFNIVFESLPYPGLYVYLHQSIPNLLKNIEIRGRDYEKNITGDYLKKIENGYFNYFKQETRFPILVVSVEKIDFIENAEDYLKIKKIIFAGNYKKGLNTWQNSDGIF